jgi:hypothetical protein
VHVASVVEPIARLAVLYPNDFEEAGLDELVERVDARATFGGGLHAKMMRKRDWRDVVGA